MARPCKLDDLVAQRIVAAVEVGAPWYMAAAAGGVNPATLRDWKARARDGEEPFAAFYARLKKAEAAGAVAALTTIQKAAQTGTWQAAAWLLERRHPQSFALRRERERDIKFSESEANEIIAQAAALHAETKKEGTS